ncbi:hypothetical protein HD554DRAFT_2077105 [Boletus coccyginus]|nr:hypothetical protein HD554DRAFT_2077105 [Boletus coccyginus]
MRGEANIQVGLESSVNKRFILHDSLGFEPGDKVNYDTVKEFIQSRQTGELKERLHAVWFCVQTPLAEGRLLEVAAEDFFRTKKETMGGIPLIVVYTQFDSFVNQLTMASMTSHPDELDEESVTKDACLKAESRVGEYHKEITQLAGESLPYEFVSTKEKYKYTLENLVKLTHDQVGIPDTRDAQITSLVTLIAQRVVPHLKIQGSIEASPNFEGRTIWECLSVIHTDIVNVWNFNDPACRLLDKEFKELVVKMVQEMDMRSALDPNKTLALGGSLAAAAPGLQEALSNPAAPIVLPVIVGVAVAVWLYQVYQNGKTVQQIFMAFIVDLTHIMELLFILTSRDHNKLTRRAIKLAYSIYYDSDLRKQVHADIEAYRDFEGRDAALEMIEYLIKPEQSGNSTDCYAKVGALVQDISNLNLDQEEDW